MVGWLVGWVGWLGGWVVSGAVPRVVLYAGFAWFWAELWKVLDGFGRWCCPVLGVFGKLRVSSLSSGV